MIRFTAISKYIKSKKLSTPSINISNRFLSSSSSLKDSYEYIKCEKFFPPPSSSSGGVALIQLNRPKAFNALCDGLFQDLIHASKSFQKHEEIGCLVVTGSKKAFAAGADIPEMKDKNFPYAYKNNMFAEWAEITKLGKPIIAAVNGYALGGGCELAMMCDIIVCGENAKFGQPEINLGIIPGAGGTQRLIREVGKSKAMEMILTGNYIMDSKEALSQGLVSHVYANPTDADDSKDEELDIVVKNAIDMGFQIASKSQLSIQMAKEAINSSYEMNLQQGLTFERRLFHSLFSTRDQKEGMSAFLEKKKPEFTHE